MKRKLLQVLPIEKIFAGRDGITVAELAELFPHGYLISETTALKIARASGFDLEGRRVSRKPVRRKRPIKLEREPKA